MHQRDDDHHIQDPGHTVVLHSAALLILALDPDPGLTLILPVDPVHAPMAGLIPAPLILDAMAAVMDDRGQGPVPVQGLMGIVGLAHRGLLPPTGQEAGREQKDQHLIGHGLPLPLALALALALVASGPAALVDESRLLGISHRMN